MVLRTVEIQKVQQQSKNVDQVAFSIILNKRHDVEVFQEKYFDVVTRIRHWRSKLERTMYQGTVENF